MIRDDTYDWNQFYGDLAASINAQTVATYRPVTLVQRPAQGDFLWYYQNAGGLFNQGTLDYISASVAQSSDLPVLASLSVSGGFVNAYSEVVAKIVYTVSTAQQGEINRVTANAASQAMTIVSDYQAIFGPITDPQMLEARAVCGVIIQTRLDYVITYILGAIWSGRGAARAALLTYQEMEQAGSSAGLAAILPATPQNGAIIIIEVWAYLQQIVSVAVVQSQAQMGSWLVAQLLSNTASPDAQNGGMHTVDPLTGMPFLNDQVGYTIDRSIAAIQQDLANPRILKASSILTGGSEPITVSFEYPGYTMVPIAAKPWQTSNDGWFLPSPISVANANQLMNVTGYHFIADPGNLNPFAFGGTFGMLTNLLISQYPIITMVESLKPSKGTDAASLAPSISLSFLESLGLQNERVTYTARTEQDPSGKIVTRWTPAAPPEEAELAITPLLMQTAFVIGCTISNPAVG